ncbi:MAG: hypothetical protein HEQ13_16935 [Dolichospermum sp. DEX189]|uniref:hypothetical protein n=1 Tax=Aphanizomenon flos-aquae TaxID=1176 RepID=UPI00126A5CA6|nr:hypothetical protein [Aphanizomenon flos-aquae]MBO1070937.1 hypothetical protein [Dolichospermum sp. DEX189]QSV70673.1 MAG: hypothetical protein HEQ20_07780 [Aphanizomenon flos-aquae KM1D3_PB]
MSLWQGKRQEARGKSEEGLGDFTFLYTVWFYCVHLLICLIKFLKLLNVKIIKQQLNYFRNY